MENSIKLNMLIDLYRKKVLNKNNELPFHREEFETLNNEMKNSNLVLIGLRQVGKTTLMEQLFKNYFHLFIDQNNKNEEITQYSNNEEKVFYLNLKSISNINNEINLIFNEISNNKYQLVALDEIQVIENWSDWLQAAIDLNPKARFIVSGSNASSLNREIMLNRAKIFYIYPLSLNEYKKIWKDNSENQLWNYLKFGSYPKSFMYDYPELQYREQVEQTIIDKVVNEDLREKINPVKFNFLFKKLKNYVGNEINVLKIHEETKISRKVVGEYMNMMLSAQLIKLIPKYKDNNTQSKNKLYLEDKSMINFFNDYYHLNNNLLGSLIENTVLMHLYKKYFIKLTIDRIFYYRNKNSNEIDFVIPRYKLLIECKYVEEFKESELINSLNETIKDDADEFKDYRKIIITKNKDLNLEDWELISLENFLNNF